jgi:hypothetical protein
MISSRGLEANQQAGQLFRLLGDYRYDLFAQKFLGAAGDPQKLSQVRQEAYDVIAVDHALRYGEDLRVEYCVEWEGDRPEVRFQIYPQTRLSWLPPHRLSFDRETLSAELLRLENEGLNAPPEYRKALRELTQRSH